MASSGAHASYLHLAPDR